MKEILLTHQWLIAAVLFAFISAYLGWKPGTGNIVHNVLITISACAVVMIIITIAAALLPW